MLIEALSFKVALDFLGYLKKARLYSENIVVGFWDRTTRETTQFTSLEQMNLYYENAYKIVDTSALGSLCYLQSVSLNSDLYDFRTEYILRDVTNSFSLTSGSSYDIQRNTERSIYVDRQTAFLTQTINEYVTFFNEIKIIYITGIYSQLYAVPGWSRNTWYLNSLKNSLLGDYSNNTFPYTNEKISKYPPLIIPEPTNTMFPHDN